MSVDKKSTLNTLAETLDSVLPEAFKTNVLDKLLPKKSSPEEIVRYEGGKLKKKKDGHNAYMFYKMLRKYEKSLKKQNLSWTD